MKKNSNVKVLPKNEEVLTAGSSLSLEDQSKLSKEITDLCKNLPIKWAIVGRKNDNEQVQDTKDNR